MSHLRGLRTKEVIALDQEGAVLGDRHIPPQHRGVGKSAVRTPAKSQRLFKERYGSPRHQLTRIWMSIHRPDHRILVSPKSRSQPSRRPVHGRYEISLTKIIDR
jgi:hypothetical protein